VIRNPDKRLKAFSKNTRFFSAVMLKGLRLKINVINKPSKEHIGDNGGKIEHQREHFVTLSKDMEDLIQLFGTNQKLYLDFCPMADDNKGAVWISETKEIKNPYFGKEMATCGSIKKEY
jgi:hypothetical protein